MGKKRRSSGTEEEGELEPKKLKATEVEFTGTHFKSLLKDPSSALNGMAKFVTLSKKLPSPNLYDVVEGYIKISVECIEILKLLDGERRPESENMVIFQALEAILLRTASDLSHLNIAGVNIVKNMLNTHMKIIYTCLYSETHRMSRICLNLLSAMVTQGPECARDVFSHFDFNNKFLPGLLKRRDKQGRPDVRMAYIQFALSFLISGDNTLIVQLLELKDFFGEIFSTGIKEDRISTLNLLLSLLETKVVHNKAITKTQKVRLFTPVILNHIASLYRWSGIVDVSTKNVTDIKDPKEAGKVMIRELVHSFLVDLCCSLKHGINFYDPSLGTAGRAGNLVLLRFLVGLKSATEDEMISGLVVSILKVCPDLLTRYFKETQYSFVPRLKSAWLDNIKLLKKIYDALPEISPAFRTQEFVPIPRLLTMVMVTTIAPVCNKALFTQGLNLPNKIVKHTILSLVASILRRAERNIDHCLREDVWQKSEIYTPAMMAEFSQKYREALSKLLPDMNIIVATWQSLLKQESAVADSENGEKVPTAEEKETELAFQEVLEKKDELHVSDDVQTTLLKATLLQVLCLYQRVVPHLVAQSTFDFGKLLKGIVSEKGIREEVPPVLQYQILQVALELPANKFAWFKVQEVSEGGEKSIFYLLLKMFATCNKAQLKSSTRLLIIKVLRDSGVFEYTWKELDLWLRNLDKIADNSKNTVIQFLERTLLRLVSNPYPYTDKAAEIVQEASLLQLSSGKQDSETVSIPVSHIDDVLDMVDVIVEGSEGLDDEVGMALDEDLILQTFPFSAVVPIALELRNSLLTQTDDGDDSVVQYLVSVLTDVLHSQRDPLALCLMLQCYDKEIKVVNRNSVQYILLGQFNDYYSLWIPASAKETLFTECDDSMIEKCQREESYSSLLKKTYASRDISKSDTEDILNNAVLKLTLDELPLAVKHSLLCLKSTVDNFSKFKKGTGASLISLYLNLLHSLLCRFDLAKAEPHEKTAESQEESELFIDANYISSIDTPDNKILEDLLTVIFKHPTLEGWFLALGRQSLPHHTLNPISVKVLSSHLNKGVIQLLSFSAPLLQQNSNLHLISKYFSAIAESILKELEDKKALNKISQPVEALQSLHPYLDTAQLNEVTLAILRLPEDHLFVMKSPNHSPMDKQLSCYGKVLVQLLTESHRRKHQLEGDLVSSVEHVKGVGSLLSPSSGGEMEAVLYEALQKDPVFSLVIGVHTLKYCLEQMTETCLSIAALLIEHSRTHLLQFELWCTNSGIQKSLRKNMEAFLPLINVYLMCRSRFQFTRPSQVSSAALCVLKEAMWSKLVNVALSSEKSSEHVLVLSSIIRESDVSDEELQNLFDQLPVALAQSWNPDKWALADAVSQSADRSGKDVSSWKQALLASCMKCLIATYSANKESEASTQEAEKALLLHLKELMPFVKKNIPTEWKTLVKTGLKYRYKDCEFLAALREGIELWYGSESLSVKGLVELPVIHMMITQHSLFLPTLLRSREEQNENNTSREMLVDLLRSVVMKCPSVCDGNHFAVLLGAYGASLSRTDQKILLLLQAYEKNNISLTEFRLLLWGPAAVEHHKTRKSLGKSLWQQPSMEEILTLLDRERVMKTILHFPQHRKLVNEQDRVFEDSAITDLDDLYDPCFLLPLFSELIRPELVVDCLKFVDVNGLGLAVAALSSYDYNMRAAAYYILGTFLSHMEGARFRDKKQLQNLMDVVKNGIRQQNLRLTFSLTLYVAKAAQQILKPEEHMYIKICRFLLSHQYLDMKKVPDFYKLFYSFDLEHKLEREWILGLLNDGMRDRYCYELYDYQRIFHVLLTFYNSPLCDEISQNQILEVLQNAALVTKAAYQLIRDQSLLTWILNILERRYLANKMLANVILLVHNLWLTNLGNKESDCSDEEQSKEGSTNKKKFLPLHFVNEFFSVLMALLRHIRSNLQFIQLKQFFSTMSSVLSHRRVVLKAFKEMGRFALNEKIFSAKDALVFLHKWSTIEKDSKLQERLSNLAQKYKVKELLDIIKEKYRPQDSRQLKKRKELEDQEDSEEQQDVISHLEDSRDHIKSILMHWEPVFSNTAFVAKKENANREGKLQTEDCNKDESSDNDQFVSATACLVANWILKTESEHAMNTQNIYKSIKWFNASIVPHTHVMQEIIKDSVLKNTIFRLFSRACSVTEMKVSSLELMHLFNTVMIRLIETQMLGKNAWHDAVKAICPDSSPDSARTAPGEFLVSLYVGDFWLGAEETGMLRSHVEVINEAAQMDFTVSKQKKPTRKKREYEEGIVSLCKDLLRR